MSFKAYLNAKEVTEILGVSRSKAYEIIKGLNLELEAEGYIVISGKVPKRYLEKKYYGLALE
jgi:sugar-specific transcriptional regulator TrmB